jgi:hypothetical protein
MLKEEEGGRGEGEDKGRERIGGGREIIRRGEGDNKEGGGR